MSRALLFINRARSLQTAVPSRAICISTPRTTNDSVQGSETTSPSESMQSKAPQLGRRRNFIRFAGLAEDDCKDNAVYLRHSHRLRIKVVAVSELMKQAMKEVKKDMNVAVQGTLIQKNIISEREGKFAYEKSDFIRPERIEIITTDEEVERKYRERPSLSDDFTTLG